MKELIIVRHSKAENPNFNSSDFDRKLTESGKVDAQNLSEYLSSIVTSIDLIIASPAKRTFKTVKILSKKLSYPADSIMLVESIYESTYINILKLISSLDNKYDRVLLCGHNPGLEDFVNYISNNSYIQLKTSGMVYLKLNIDKWIECSENSAEIIDKKNVG